MAEGRQAGRNASSNPHDGDFDPLAAPLVAQRAMMQGLMERHGISMFEVERGQCMIRDTPLEETRRTTLILRRGTPDQNRNWFAGAGTSGPVVIIGVEQWIEMLLSFDRAADGIIEHLSLHRRPGEICLVGGSGGAFCGMMLAAHMAERLPGSTIKMVAFSLVTRLHHVDAAGRDQFWPHMIVGFRERPGTIEGMKRYHSVRPFFERALATPGTDFRVRAFTTPLSQTDFEQASIIADLPCVTLEEVMTNDYNHDMMAWASLQSQDIRVLRQKLLQWMAARNPNWPQRTLETRVDREMEAALVWRARYPHLPSLFEGF